MNTPSFATRFARRCRCRSLRFSLKLGSHRLPHDMWVDFVSVSGYLIFFACAYGAVGKLDIAELRGPVVVGCKGWLWLDE